MLALPPTAAPPVPAHTYLQLRSTSYPTGARLPNGIRKPRPRPADLPADAAGRLPEGAQLRQVVADAQGILWAAAGNGIYIYNGSDGWQRMDRADGVPYDDIACLHLAANGDLWAGTPEGAWRLRAGRYSYFRGKRWMPGNRVASIWSESESRTWLETDGGYACIEERPTTLAEKAAHFDRITQERHNRRGYIGNIHLKRPGDPTGGWYHEAADSDGLWTGYYVAAMSLRYAATHDPAARRQAKQSMEAMLELERLTGIAGYPARSVATDAEIRGGIRGYDPNSTVRVAGEIDKYWVRSPVEPGVWCKSDTSSDTMDGHYFAWYMYYTHVADAAEKARLAALVRRATDHIIDNGYVLIGHTGRKTRWGVWAPKYLNGDPEWAEQRGLNSLEILSHLKVARYITGDAKYDLAYDDLVEKHHYLQNTLLLRRGKLGEWRTINHSDDQLACIAAYPLLMLETDPARRRILTQAVARTWEGEERSEQPIRLQRSSFYNFAYGAMTGNPCAVEDALADLREWPWDLVDWAVDNSRRHDVQVRREEGLDDPVQLDRVVSPGERFLKRWNGNPWKAAGGSDGAVEHDGSTWLIAYWLGVYHGYIPR
ncbi:MAG: hypothetical protein NT029_12345 [Armatimonadetes bacterium]|nr:hypothetical protein [Armatimonadota bacterium]